MRRPTVATTNCNLHHPPQAMFLPLIIAITCVVAQTTAAETESTLGTEHDDGLDSLANCLTPYFSLEPDEFDMFPNGTAYVPAYNRTYNASSYHVEEDGFLTICPPGEVFSSDGKDELNGTSTALSKEPLEYVSKIGVGISMVCLLVHLVVFAVVRDLRNLPGYNLASLCLSLLLSYVSMIVSRSDLSGNSTACVTFAILTQFFFLASFLWMFVMSTDVFRAILLATESLRATSKGFKIKKYVFNSCVCWGTSLVFAVAAYLADILEGVPADFRPNFQEKCWFGPKHSLLIFFAGPFFAIICLNFLLFAVSAYTVYANRMRTTKEDGSSANLRENHVMYFRLAVIMGATWIVGVVAALGHKVWLWYLFSLLNAFQGFFILVAFTCTEKVKKFFRQKLSGARRSSEQTTTPTFQSYCFYANSLDKDLDKVGESKEKSGSIDTIVIHI